MAINLFAGAKVAIAKKPSNGKKAVERPSVHADDLASISAALKSLQTLYETMAASLQEEAMAAFMKEGCTLKRKPDNFTAVGEIGAIGVQLKKRSSASGLSDEEIALLKQHNVSLTTVSDIPAGYMLNPIYNEDPRLEKWSNALVKAGAPADIFVRTDPKVKTVVTETSLEEVFKLDPEVAETLVTCVSTFATRPTIEEKNLEAALDRAVNLLRPSFADTIKSGDLSLSEKKKSRKAA